MIQWSFEWSWLAGTDSHYISSACRDTWPSSSQVESDPASWGCLRDQWTRLLSQCPCLGRPLQHLAGRRPRAPRHFGDSTFIVQVHRWADLLSLAWRRYHSWVLHLRHSGSPTRVAKLHSNCSEPLSDSWEACLSSWLLLRLSILQTSTRHIS